MAAKAEGAIVPEMVRHHMTQPWLLYYSQGIKRLGITEREKDVDEETIKDILRYYPEKIKNIRQKMLSLYQETESEEVLSAVALPPINMSGMPGAKGNHKDLGDVLISYQKQIWKRNEEIREMMWQLSEEEAMVRRVWACFHVLDNPYYSILHALYVENQLYMAVESSFDMSHKTFEKYRRDGINLLIRFYESNETIPELMRKYRNKNKMQKRRKKADNQEKEYRQIDLSDLMKL